MTRPALLVALLLWIPLVSGCSALIGRATSGIASDLEHAMLDQTDPATVRDGAPAYLLMLDALIEGSPDDADLLLAGASLYGTYAGAFVDDPARAERLTDRALGYAQRAVCATDDGLCAALGQPFDAFEQSASKADDVAVLYGLGTAWAGWIQTRASDWKAVADVPKVETLMGRVLALDEAHADGGAHLYMGVLLTLRPAALGGRPEEGRAHFERAIELSEGRDLMAKVFFARQYARLVFDRELHDRLLGEVVAADPAAPGRTLANLLAQDEARVLLDDADDYF